MLSILLTPFSVLYGLITRLRNGFYDRGWIKSYSFDSCATICVGNLSVGGTGKTPMVEYLIRLLLPHYSLAVLSRGYGRQTKGFRLAGEQDTASTLGDEPFQFYKKWQGKISVAVCENRVEGMNRLLNSDRKIDVVLLDDAFQHRRLKPSFSILLTDYSKPFFVDHLLPKGRLREGRRASTRAQVVVVTKCPATVQEASYRSAIHNYAAIKPLFFSSIKYGTPVALAEGSQIGKDVLLVTGIANSKPLVDYCHTVFTVKGYYHFVDHHHYSPADIISIQERAIACNSKILTTEKDMVKLISGELTSVLKKDLWFYQPIETFFLNSGSEFDNAIVHHIENYLHRSTTK
ncbi:MAG: tetraacyldisaccharide 4'-kinase [Bacteroidetes bacterium]|nr:tetraacyldisaccharide 4'-kinase [Bacteroidota bacterium]MBS1541740.1 tetraacyldisaccharide 4'-kinase [Bacteroidota bacterium]